MDTFWIILTLVVLALAAFWLRSLFRRIEEARRPRPVKVPIRRRDGSAYRPSRAPFWLGVKRVWREGAFWTLGILVAASVFAQPRVPIRIHSHATDCTALTNGLTADICIELDDDTLYSCQPTAGFCDTAGEWVLTGDGGGGTPGGSSGEIQFNNAGAFGGVTGSSVANGGFSLGLQNVTAVGIEIEAASGQTADLFQLTSNGGTAGDLFKVEADGDLILKGGQGLIYSPFDPAVRIGKNTTDWFQVSASGASTTLTGSRETTLKTNAGGLILDPSSGTVTVDDVLHINPKATAPATCSIGDVYSDTSGALCHCAATNTWEALGATGSCA